MKRCVSVCVCVAFWIWLTGSQPVFLYLTIAIFEVLLDPSGSTVVAARYLLLNARQIYSNLFGLQETWLLLIVQAALTIIQTILTVCILR
eukprot:SAG31_NODE_222_length_19895_cov_34.907626_11_plen_90_part_00